MKNGFRNSKKVRSENECGSITVFFVIIFLVIILLTGSMVDLSRIMVADNKMDSAMRASTKSLMAEYNADLAGAYGIFANDLEANRETFTEYLNKNLELSSNAFMNYELLPDTVKVVGNDNTNLANDEVLKAQIRSYMETKAKVNTGLRVAQRTSDVLKTVIKSNFEGLLKANDNDSESQVNKVLDEQGAVLGKSADEIEKTELENAQSILNKEIAEMEENAEKTIIELKKDALADAIDDMSLYSLKQEDLIKSAAAEIENMEHILQQIEDLKQELDDAQNEEEPDQGLIDRLQREIAALKAEYTEARERISASVDAAKEGSAYGEGEIFEFSRMKNLRELGHEIPGLDLASEPLAADPTDKSLSEKLLEFKNTLQSIAGLDLKSKAEDLAESYYMVEYVMDRCTYATSADRSLSQFKYGEVEYILNGSDNQLTNLLAAYLKVFIFCYVINVIDLCLTGVPLWPAALMGSLGYTAYSMNTIYTGETYVPLKLYLKRFGLSAQLEELVGLQYSDLLYIQLFLKKDDTVLKRVRNLMIANINRGNLTDGIQASDLYTQVDTEAQASVNLLFLPMLPLDNLNVSGFENGRYTIRKTYSFAYQ